jgi:hypothetical protein
MRKLTVVIALAIAAVALAEESATDRFQKVADRLVAAVNAADYPGIQRDFNEEVLKAFPRDKCDAFFKGLVDQLGKIQKLDAPRFVPPNQAIFPAHFERGLLDLRIVLDEAGKIAGLWMQPHTPAIPAVEKHETPLALPFKGRWLVVWGGDTKALNQHHDSPGQRFAFDFLGVGPDGKTRKGVSNSNEDYYAFGREVLAPADGTVTDVIEGVRDNVPGSMNPYSAVGNGVVLQHREREVSVLAHFKQGSIGVKVGDKVKRGQVLGLCGNSGNSSEPHVHYHLQNTPILQEGTGIKCLFRKVALTRDGKTESKAECSPVKGEIVEPVAEPAGGV